MELNRVSENVKQVSGSSHQALEKIIIQLIKRIDSLPDYCELLKLFYGYYQPLEVTIGKQLHLSTSFSGIRQTSLLEHDINALQPGEKQFQYCQDLPVIQSPADALAALYVLQGSTLGGKYILQMIRKKISLPEGSADFFFKGSGEQTATNWQLFRETLDAEVEEEGQPAFFEKVKETFDLFKSWAALKI